MKITPPLRSTKIVRVQRALKHEHVPAYNIQSRTDRFRLPKWLVGIKSTAQVTVRGEEVNCLLGSQVTTVPESFYKQHLSEQKIKPLHDLLEVEGANGQLVALLWLYRNDYNHSKSLHRSPNGCKHTCFGCH